MLAYLQKSSIQQLVAAGMMTHMGLDATVRAAADFGYDRAVRALLDPDEPDSGVMENPETEPVRVQFLGFCDVLLVSFRLRC